LKRKKRNKPNQVKIIITTIIADAIIADAHARFEAGYDGVCIGHSITLQ
jgi:hypothetical protein